MKALVIVDVQNDFITGSLPVPGAIEIIPFINSIIPQYDFVVYSQDWHPKDHCSFKDNGGLWPAHCVRGSIGAALHTDLDMGVWNHFVHKGQHPNADSYSAFKDDNGIWTPLRQTLKKLRIWNIDVVGLATDYCVKATVLDALSLGIPTKVLLAGCRGVAEDTTLKAIHEMVHAGAVII